MVATIGNTAARITDRRTQQAVVLSLMTIGEAAARIVNECKEFAAAHPVIPWARMRGMRNRMVHGYFDVDLNIVWGRFSVRCQN